MAGQAKRGFIEMFPDALTDQAQRTLVVGNVSRWESEGRTMPELAGFRFIDIGDLTKELVTQAAPDIILSPLVADDFDAVDVAEKLVSLGFGGRYRAISPNLPDARLIRDELRGFAPQLDFDILLMPDTDEHA